MRGYPGSGKSTEAQRIAKENNSVICSMDDFRYVDGKYVFDFKDQKQIAKSCFDKFGQVILSGRNVIVDNTNIKFDDICKYIDYILVNNNQNDFIYSVELVEVEYNSIEEAIKLRSNREDGKNIAQNIMRKMYKSFKHDIRGQILDKYKYKLGLGKLDDLVNELPFTINDKQKAVVCDLDGTLSLFEYTNGIKTRSPYDASTSNNDFINIPVAVTIKALQDTGYEIIFVSGREDVYRNATLEFLERVQEETGLVIGDLHMRASGDFRSDDIIKSEIYHNLIEPNYNVVMVFDDRPKVVKMWRSLNLFVFDCNYRGKDF
jgi:predicted kinase